MTETIKGFLQFSPDLRYTQTGLAIATFKIADIEIEDNYSNHKNIVCWDETAEKAYKHIEIFNYCYFKGFWKNNKWKDDYGNERSNKQFTANDIWLVFENKPINIKELF